MKLFSRLMIILLLIPFFSQGQKPSVLPKTGSQYQMDGTKGWYKADSGFIWPSFNAKKSRAGDTFNLPGRGWYDQLGDSSYHGFDGKKEFKFLTEKDTDYLKILTAGGSDQQTLSLSGLDSLTIIRGNTLWLPYLRKTDSVTIYGTKYEIDSAVKNTRAWALSVFLTSFTELDPLSFHKIDSNTHKNPVTFDYANTNYYPFSSNPAGYLTSASIVNKVNYSDSNSAYGTKYGIDSAVKNTRAWAASVFLTSVSGTLHRITSSGGPSPVIDIASDYVGQTSITTVGVLTTGTYQATAIVDAYIASASIWNAKQGALSGTGIVKSTGGTISYINGTSGQFVKGDGSLDGTAYGLGSVTSIVVHSLSPLFTASVSGTAAVPIVDYFGISQAAHKFYGNNGSVGVPSFLFVQDADLSLSDITTNNSSTSNHGFLKKLNNVSTNFMDGTGAWSTPAGTVYTGTNGVNVTGTVISVDYTYAGTFTNATWHGVAIADAQIASAATWNAKQAALSGTGIVKSTAGTISYINGTSGQFVKGDGSLDGTAYGLGSVTSVATYTLTGLKSTVQPITGSGTLYNDSTIIPKWDDTVGGNRFLVTPTYLSTFNYLSGNLSGDITSLGTVTSYNNKVPLSKGGSNADLSGTGGAGQYLKQISSGAAITVGTIPSTDITGLNFLPLAGGTMTDGANIAVGTTTGTKIGTATNQKIGFFNATPVVQQSGDIVTALINLGLISSGTVSATIISGTTVLTSAVNNAILYTNGSGVITTNAGFGWDGTTLLVGTGNITGSGVAGTSMTFLANSSANIGNVNTPVYLWTGPVGNASTANNIFEQHTYSVNQTSSASYSMIKYSMVETGTGSGTKNLMSWNAGSTGTTNLGAFDNTGLLTTTGGMTSTTITASTALVSTGAFRTGATGPNCNIFANFGIAANNRTELQFMPSGITNMAARTTLGGSTIYTVTAGNSYSSVDFGGTAGSGSPVGAQMAATGTHQLFCNVLILPPHIVSGAATLTNSASLWVDAAPSLGTNKYAIWCGGAMGGSNNAIPNNMLQSSVVLTNVNSLFLKSVASQFSTLTDASTVAIDLSLSNNYQVQLAANRTLGVPSNIVAGTVFQVNVYQDGTGSRTLALPFPYTYGTGATPVFSTGHGSMDKLSCSVDYYAFSTTTTCSTTGANAIFTWTSHGLFDGQQLQYSAGTTTTPALATTYWVHVLTANTFNLSSSFALYQAGTYITSSGTSGNLTATACGISISLSQDYHR